MHMNLTLSGIPYAAGVLTNIQPLLGSQAFFSGQLQEFTPQPFSLVQGSRFQGCNSCHAFWRAVRGRHVQAGGAQGSC